MRKHFFLFQSQNRKMEERHQLDSDAEAVLFCLHLVFTPLIRQHLEEFQNGWNLHVIRTTPGCSSPIRLFVQGLANLRQLSVEINEFFTKLIQVKPSNTHVVHVYAVNKILILKEP